LFGRVGKNQEILRGASHHFFTEESAAALNQTEVRSDFVGSVDIQIEDQPLRGAMSGMPD
jgi:hypothetical protein